MIPECKAYVVSSVCREFHEVELGKYRTASLIGLYTMKYDVGDQTPDRRLPDPESV